MKPLTLAVVVTAVLAAPAAGQIFRWLAFGDSITRGWSDEAGLGGYPGRLEDDFGCTPSTCEVFNAGQSFETAAEGVTRIDQVLNNNGPFDVAMIMEGTNDIWGPNNINQISIPTIVFNLDTIASKAEAAGVEAVPTSIIWFHPDGHPKNPIRNPLIQNLRNQLQSSASTNARLFVDQWSILCPAGGGQSACFDNHYWHDPDTGLPDVVGHPDASGFDLMANEFFAVINAIPVPTPATPNSPSGEISDDTPTLIWTKESPARATWYQVRITPTGGTALQAWRKASQVCSGSTCSTMLASALDDGNFSWQVMSRNARGRSDWSSPLNFTLTTSLIFSDSFESGDLGAWSSSQP